MPSSRSRRGASGSRANRPRILKEWPRSVRARAEEILDLQRQLRELAEAAQPTPMMDTLKPGQMMRMSEIHRKLHLAYANLSKELVYHLSRRKPDEEGSNTSAAADPADRPVS